MRGIARLAVLAAGLAARGALAAGPDCSAPMGVRALVCADPELRDDERVLEGFLDEARRKAGPGLAALDAGQRAWLAARERCVSDVEPWACVRDRTLRRTAALQARYRLSEPTGQARFACDAAGHDVLEIEFFPTGALTRTAIARRRGTEVLLWLADSASGARYVGPGAQVWLAHGEALVRWGGSDDETTCRAADD